MAKEWKGLEYFRMELQETLGELLAAGLEPTVKGLLVRLIENRGIWMNYAFLQGDENMRGLYVDMRGEGLRQMIYIKSGQSEEQELATLTHELAHYFTLPAGLTGFSEQRRKSEEQWADVLGSQLLQTTRETLENYYQHGFSTVDGAQTLRSFVISMAKDAAAKAENI